MNTSTLRTVSAVFGTMYLFCELVIQRDCSYPEWTRFYLSDFFGGPIMLIMFHLIYKSRLLPLYSMCGCIFFELISYRPDYVDILCYICGTLTLYLITYFIEKK